MPQDFSGQNLRGRSFKGQNLDGADFSHADIRSADFSKANLRGAKFVSAKAGLQRRWVIGLVIVSWLLAAVSGTFLVFEDLSVALIVALMSDELFNFIAGAVSLIVLVAFYVVFIREGSVAAFAAVAFTFAVAVATGAQAVAVAVAFAGVLTLLNAYIGWRALARDRQHAWIREIAIAFAATGGTSFRGADLTDADFTRAVLKSTDFQKAILTRTCWHQTQKLDRVRPGTTYLQNAQLRQLLLTGQGQDQNFDHTDLRGVNLQAANLQDASFIGANLSAANLQDADLSRAKLVQTQLDRTDLTGATLTGAYIEDWGITGETQLDGVRCKYVFMRLPTKEDPDSCRKPDNRQEEFEDGGFGDFIKPIIDTLDLYHSQGVDPRALAIAFKQLAENNPEAELEIVAMEKRGRDKFLLRAKTATTADKSELSQEYFETYNQLKALPEREIKLLMAGKDNRIRSLENMVETALQRPSFYAQNYQNQGDTMSDKSSDIKFGNVGGALGAFAGGDISGVAGKDITGAAGGDLSGTVTTTIGQLQESNAPEAPQLADLLQQLQTAIESDTNLSADDKAEALEQVKALAEAGQSPKEGRMQKTAKTAITMLKGLFTGLPAVATLVDAGQKLLPAIAQLFGLSL